jgi:hypothetical protein
VPARLAVGNNGETLVADSSTSTGLRYTAGTVQANPVLNSAMQVWQRGTSFSAPGNSTYQADRWMSYGAGAGFTITRQATSDTTNLPFIQYCTRYARNSGSTSTAGQYYTQSFENVNSTSFIGKTVTLSFYARGGANYSAASSFLNARLVTGTGTDQNVINGLTGTADAIAQNAILTTTWQRFTYTGTISSSATQIALQFLFIPVGTAGANDYFEVTGVQIDIGSVALPFRTYAGTIQGELAACQRYYFRLGGQTAFQFVSSNGVGQSSTTAVSFIEAPVTMRVVPTTIDFSTLRVWSPPAGVYNSISSVTIDSTSGNKIITATSTSTGLSTSNYYQVQTNNSTSAFLGFGAEL